jgi:hypothetical protein
MLVRAEAGDGCVRINYIIPFTFTEVVLVLKNNPQSIRIEKVVVG